MSDLKKGLEEIKNVVGPENFFTDEVDTLPSSRDRWPVLANKKYLKLADAVVTPTTTKEVVEIVKIANKYRIPIIPSGGRTNFCGGVVPVNGGVIVDTYKMDKILEISRDDLLVRVQPGVVLQTLERELEKHDLVLGHDIGGYPSATVGGAISTDGLGRRAGKYGAIRDMVLGLEVVLPTGDVLKIRGVRKSSSGLNLKYLFIGAEGTLGIITEAVLKVRPKPERIEVLVFEFEDFEKAFNFSKAIVLEGITPSVHVVNDQMRSGMFQELLEREVKASVVVVFEGKEEEVEVYKKLVSNISNKMGGKALPDDIGKIWWEKRHAVYPLENKVKTYDTIVEMSLPYSKIPEAYKKALDILKKHGLDSMGMGVFAMSHGTLSIDFLFDEKDEEDIQRYLQVSRELRKMAIDMGGTQTYCIGVGIGRKDLVEYEHGIGYKVMKEIKKALDPNNIMNPGKWL